MLIHIVQVETQTDTGPYGDQYAAPVTVPCFIDDARQIVRNAEGAEVVSETTLLCTLDRAEFVPDSRVTLPDGRVAFVLMAKRRDAGSLGAPSHLEVTL
jgi:hypothetical protein